MYMQVKIFLLNKSVIYKDIQVQTKGSIKKNELLLFNTKRAEFQNY
jgi:hypothetical protein